MKKILILSASIGAGHVSAAEALCRTYQEQFQGEARHVDFLRFVSPALSKIVEQTYYLMTKRVPSLYRFIYEKGDRPRSLSKKLDGHIGASKYVELINEFQPDAIISTHFLPAAVVSYLFPELPIPNGVILTDYVSHRLWVYQYNQMFFVAHEGMKKELKELGVEASRIRVTGIPARPFFRENLDRVEVRKKLQIPLERPLILVMSGGNAIGPLAEILEALQPLRDRIQVVTITGKNKQLQSELQPTMNKLQMPGRVLGFVDNMHEWMAAADLLISKPGGLTVTEALISGLPLLIIRPTPGQEDGNTEFLTSSGSGIYLQNVDEVKSVVGELLDNPDKLLSMREKAKSLGKPNAAENILREMEALLMGKKDFEPEEMVNR